ncbi:hypothetical protein BD311DRAFT_359883 [Dichomitus squalens]|uniref:Uncharacterized protein n=1 Tax=Dichomitus squalens TaxID=114155 RepID=A0A4Q9MLU5_9APHY|nr:hypothetical protein BD311DRAFT_359883 [Dichomitus squalens]
MHMILPTCILVMGTPLPRKQFWYLAYAARSLIRNLLVYGRSTRPRREAMSSSHTLFRRVIARRSYHCLTRGLKASRDSTAQRRYVDRPCDIAKTSLSFALRQFLCADRFAGRARVADESTVYASGLSYPSSPTARPRDELTGFSSRRARERRADVHATAPTCYPPPRRTARRHVALRRRDAIREIR